MRFFEGTPAAIVPDNLKSAVTKSSRFEPTINETLADLAEHYQTTILPARANKPRDKSLVEGAVKILYRRVYVNLKEILQFYLQIKVVKASNNQVIPKTAKLFQRPFFYNTFVTKSHKVQKYRII